MVRLLHRILHVYFEQVIETWIIFLTKQQAILTTKKLFTLMTLSQPAYLISLLYNKHNALTNINAPAIT